MYAITFLFALYSLTAIHTLLVNAFVPSTIAPVPQLPLYIRMATLASEKEGGRDHQMIHRYDSPFFLDAGVDTDDDPKTCPAALIILNTPFKSNNPSRDALPGALSVLWEKSSYRVCADGGANRLFEATVVEKESSDEIISCYLPDLITGDLDSLYPHVREYYEQKGVPVVRVEDQDYHDLDKALMATEKWIETTTSSMKGTTKSVIKTKVFIYGGFGGRFDQEMGCMNALHVWGQKETFQHTSMAVYGEETCAFLLPATPTVNEIRIPFPDGKYVGETNGHDLVGEGPSCGLIPLGRRCDEVVTTGLKWNLHGDIPLEFGGLVSSSNRIMDEVVTVQTSSPMIFTTEMINR